MDTLHNTLCSDATRQSERDFPRTSSHNGFTDGTKMVCNARVGNMLIFLCVTYTNSGMGLLRKGLRDEGISQHDFQRCIKLQLGFQKWVHEHNSIVEVKKAKPLLVEFMDLLKKCFPREEGNKWKVSKYHSLACMLYYIGKFGSADNFTGETGERLLTRIVKDVAKQTQQVPAKFAEQLGNRMFESQVLEHAFEYAVKPALGLDYTKVNNKEAVGVSGKYDLHVGMMDHHGRVGSIKVVWDFKDRNKLKLGISEGMKAAILKFHSMCKCPAPIYAYGYTSYTKFFDDIGESVLFHANEMYRGGPWYDWCFVQFNDANVRRKKDSVCPAKLLGFIKYINPGTPTPNLFEQHTLEEIEDKAMVDDTLYAVVHAAAAYLPMHELEREFLKTFQLGDVGTCIYIVPVDSIIAPCFVLDNYGRDRTGHTHMCVLPYRKWGNYIRRQLV